MAIDLKKYKLSPEVDTQPKLSANTGPAGKPKTKFKDSLLYKVGNLLTQSEQNLGKDIGRGLLGGDKFQEGLVSQYEENATKLLQLAKKQTNILKKNKYEKMAKEMFEDGLKAGEDFEGRTWKQIVGDVAGVALDVGTTLTGLGAAKSLKGLSAGKKILKGGTTTAKYGTAYGLAGGAQEDKSALGILASGVVGGVTGFGLGAGLTAGGIAVGKVAREGLKGLLPKSENIMNRVARLTPNQSKQFIKLAGESHGSYLTRTGNFGKPEKIVENEATKFINSLDEVDRALSQIPGTHSSPQLTTVLDDLVEREIKIGVANPESALVGRLAAKNKGIGLTMSEANQIKRIYERTVKLGYQKEQNAIGIARSTRLDNALREWQFKVADKFGFKNLPQLNKQTQLSKFIVDELGSQLGGKTGNNAITLTDWIVLSGGDPTAISAFFAKKFFSNKGIQAGIAKKLAGKPVGAITAEQDILQGVSSQLGRTPLLEAPKGNMRSSVGSGPTIPIAPKGSKMEFIGQGIVPPLTKGATPKTTLGSKVSKDPLAQKARKDTITLYRASPNLPTSGNFKKGTYFADNADKAGYYSQSHLQPGQVPEDIKIEQFVLPKNSVFREPSTGNYRVVGDVPVKRAISKELDPLVLEARKYKSAEEFVNSQRKLYKGTGGELDIQSSNLSDYLDKAKASKPSIKSTSYSSSLRQAESYGKVGEYFVNPKDIMPEAEYGKIIDDIVSRNKGTYSIPTLWRSEKFGQEIADAVRKKGYKGFEASVSWNKSPEIVLLDDMVTKTKSQLTDFYNKVVKKKK